MVTHQLQFLESVDQIVILSNGHVEAVGSYQTLRQSGLDFAKLLAEPAKGETGEENKKLRRSSSSDSKPQLNRLDSTSSMQSIEEAYEETENNMEVAEKRAKGSIGLQMYGKYFKASGGYLKLIVMIFFCITAQLLASAGDYYVNYW